MKILIVDDHDYVPDGLKMWIAAFWPPEVPPEVVTALCSSADLAIEAVKDYQPDVLFLDYSFGGRDRKTGKDVALWIDRNYQKPIRVATHSSHYNVRELFSGAECVKHFISGISDTEHIKKFIEHCTGRKVTNGY